VRSAKPVSRLHSKDPVDAAWRREQAHVDADIEGLSRDPEPERFIADMDAAGIERCEMIKRIKRYFKDRDKARQKGGVSHEL
jgi:hypothetical protein